MPNEDTTEKTDGLPEAAEQVSVLVTEDGMAADVVIRAPEEGEDAVSEEAVLAALHEAGVVEGIDRNAVRLAVEGAAEGSGGLVRVAWGCEPVDGKDGYVEYHAALLEAAGRPKVAPDGTVNLYDLNVVRNVEAGTLLATLVPGEEGTPGANVIGAKVRALHGATPALRAGRGATLSEDGRTVTAAIDGHATIINGDVAVTDTYVVSGDLGASTGNIKFVGSVVIRGNVPAGFVVTAEGDVEIAGGVHGGTVEAAGNVTVRYGIIGGGRGRVVAGGAVKAKFIETAEVVARTSVWASDGIVQSQVEAGEVVEVLGRRGAIVGGCVTAKSRVSARTIGSAMGNKTEVRVGVLPDVRTERIEIQRALNRLEESAQQSSVTVQAMVARLRQGTLPAAKGPVLEKMLGAQAQVTAKIEQLKARNAELEAMMREARSARVKASDSCYPGVQLSIGNVSHDVTLPLKGARFQLDKDLEVVVVPVTLDDRDD